MKVYSIGREDGCDIVINDRTDVISRRHAILSVSTSGKMTITDLSANGTYVNGIRIATNVSVPVTRKDNISFAHVARLDWNRIPQAPGTIVLRYTVAGIVGVLFIYGCIILIRSCGGETHIDPSPIPIIDTARVVPTPPDKRTQISYKEQHIKDSLHQDSLLKAQREKRQKREKKADEPTTGVDSGANADEKTKESPAPAEEPAKPSEPKRLGR